MMDDHEGKSLRDICSCSSICWRLMLLARICEMEGWSRVERTSFWKVIMEGEGLLGLLLLVCEILRFIFTLLPLTT